jgi:ATP-binding cassette, subfamily F, member 3
MLAIEDLHLAPGSEDLLLNADWKIVQGQRIGLIGRNGTGKTTLLRTLIGDVLPLQGNVVHGRGLRLGYLPQKAVAGSERPLWDEARSGMVTLGKRRTELEKWQAAVEQGQPGAEEKWAESMEAWRLAGGYSEEETIGGTLHGLGFAASDWKRPCSTFSGGWQMRIALAKLLLSEPDIALLDEPTNHLDIHARSWLAAHLAGASYAMVLVSHDRHFLDKVTDRIVEIRGKRLHFYVGNYSSFIGARELRMSQEQSASQRQAAEKKRLQDFIDRFGTKATKARQAQSMKKRLEKMEDIALGGGIARAPKLSFGTALACPSTPFRIEQGDIGWPGEAPLFQLARLDIHSGMKLALVGPNGCGKSSLMRSLLGELPLHGGRIFRGEGLRIGVFRQDVAQALPADHTPLSHLQESCSYMKTGEEIRRILGSMGLESQAHLRRIGILSGGEKARVALAELILGRHNILMLDEPTNHLDVETATALAEALKNYDGTLILISHDRGLVTEVSSHIGLFEGGEFTLHEGVDSSLLEHKPLDRKEESRGDGSGSRSHSERRKRRNRRRGIERKLQETEEGINALEEAMGAIDSSLDSTDLALEVVQELASKREKVENELEESMEHWEALSMELEEMGGT